jgi:glycosyltransferase 2 family protein
VTDPAAKRGGTTRVLTLLRWVAFSACVLLFVRALAEADLAAAWGRIRGIGPIVVVALVPFLFALAMDAWAWKGLLAALDRKVPWFTLFKVRIATEAVTNSAPAGALWADAISPILVARRAGTPHEDVFAASTAKRWTVVRMHGAYVALAGAFGASHILRVSRGLVGNDALLVVMLGASLMLVTLSFGIEALAARGRVAGRVSGMLGRARFVRLKVWIEARRHHFARADLQLARLSKNPRAGVNAAWRMLGLWVFEGLESYVLLRLLGAPLSLVEVLAFDAALSVVRSSAMFAPAGIGVQDIGYLAVLQAYGVPEASTLGPAFVVLKRLKEAVWIAVGFIMLARSGPRAVIAEAAAEVKAEAFAEAKIEAEVVAQSAASAPPPPQPPSAAT